MGADSSKSGAAEALENPFEQENPTTQVDNVVRRRHPVLGPRSHSVPSGPGCEDFLEDSLPSAREHLQRHKSTMVVVNKAQDTTTSEQDPLLQKLEELHFFYPLMHDVEKRSGLFGTHNRKALADIQSKIQSTPAVTIVRMYEDRLKRHGESVSLKQTQLTSAVKETDSTVSSLLKSYSARAKDAARYVDRLTKLDDVKRNLSKCLESFNECVAIIELLNDLLPEHERLEPLQPWSDERGAECFDESDKIV